MSLTLFEISDTMSRTTTVPHCSAQSYPLIQSKHTFTHSTDSLSLSLLLSFAPLNENRSCYLFESASQSVIIGSLVVLCQAEKEDENALAID